MTVEPIVTSRLIILGSKGGPAIRRDGPSPTSSVVEIGGRVIVVDCGLGVTRGLVQAGIDLKSLDLIMITHLHSDHVLELGPLIHTAWTSGLATPIEIHGPVGTRDYWLSFLNSMSFDIDLRIKDEGRPDLRELVVLREFSEGCVYDNEDLQITALRVDHPPVTECYALKLECCEKVIVFSSDSCYFPALSVFAEQADILVHEAMHQEGVERLITKTANATRLREHLFASHTLACDVGKIAHEGNVKHLVLHHLVPADDPQITQEHWQEEIRKEYAGPLSVGYDGLSIELE